MTGEEENKDRQVNAADETGPGCLGKTIKTVVVLIVLVCIVGFFFTLEKVQPWETGLRYWNITVPGLAKRGDVNQLDPGYSVIIPYLHEFNRYDCTIHRFEMAPPSQDAHPDQEPLRVRTAKDQDEIDVYVTILYHVDRNQIEKNVQNTGQTGLRENYSDNKAIKEKGIKAICPQVLQARLGEIMTANQFYSMTKKKRTRIKERIKKLNNITEDYKLAEKEKEELESLPRRTPEQRRELKELEDELEELENKAGKIELKDGKPDVTGKERIELLADALSELRSDYPTDQYLLDRSTQMQRALEEMNLFFKPRGIEVTAVLIWDFKFKDRIEASIISKVIADERVEMEKALKEAAQERAEWQRLLANANASAEAELARGSARAREIDAEADRYMTEKIALGDKMIMQAKAEGKGKIKNALAGKGGEVYVGLEYANALKGLQLIVLPAGGPDGVNPLQLGKSIKQIQPSIEGLPGGEK
ncbi:MAG: SPFH domain-containing protein [bacterium]